MRSTLTLPLAIAAGIACLAIGGGQAQARDRMQTVAPAGLGKPHAGTYRHARVRSHRTTWPRLDYSPRYYDPYCGPPPAYGVYIGRAWLLVD